MRLQIVVVVVEVVTSERGTCSVLRNRFFVFFRSRLDHAMDDPVAQMLSCGASDCVSVLRPLTMICIKIWEPVVGFAALGKNHA